MTEMQKLMGKSAFEEILGDLIYKPPGKPILVIKYRQASGYERNKRRKTNLIKLWMISIMANMNRTKLSPVSTQNFLISTVGKPVSINGELKSILYLYLFQRTIQKP